MDEKSHVKQIGEAFGKSAYWGASILGRLNVPVEDDGTFDPEAAREALEAAVSIREHPLLHALPDQLRAAEMGNTEESCRTWLIGELAQHGIEVIGRAMRRASRMTLRLPGGGEIRILTYAALKTKSTGQVGFTVNYLDDPGLDWVAFIAKPFGKAYLRRRDEILERLRSKDLVKTATVTFSAGSDSDRLERRIKELIRGG